MLVNWLGRSRRAMPKSINLTVPSSHSQMFSGLMSRCTVSRWANCTRRAQLARDAAHLGDREPLGQLGATLDLLPQVVAFEQLHRQERQAVGLVEVVDAHNVDMGQAAGDLRLVVESFQGFGIFQELGKEHLDGDFLVANAIKGGEDRAHAAGAQMGADFVTFGQHAAGTEPKGERGFRRFGCFRRAEGERGGARAGRSSCLVRERGVGLLGRLELLSNTSRAWRKRAAWFSYFSRSSGVGAEAMRPGCWADLASYARRIASGSTPSVTSRRWNASSRVIS